MCVFPLAYILKRNGSVKRELEKDLREFYMLINKELSYKFLKCREMSQMRENEYIISFFQKWCSLYDIILNLCV